MAGAWFGMDEIIDSLTAQLGRAEVVNREFVGQALAVVQAAAMRNFQGSHAKGQPHVGGPFPNVVTGTARRSIHTSPLKQYGLGDVGGQVGPTVKYGRRLELGYPEGQHAYPFLKPGVQSSRARIEQLRWAAYAKIRG